MFIMVVILLITTILLMILLKRYTDEILSLRRSEDALKEHLRLSNKTIELLRIRLYNQSLAYEEEDEKMIISALKALMIKTHPDTNQGKTSDKFLKAQKLYQRLKR